MRLDALFYQNVLSHNNVTVFFPVDEVGRRELVYAMYSRVCNGGFD